MAQRKKHEPWLTALPKDTILVHAEDKNPYGPIPLNAMSMAFAFIESNRPNYVKDITMSPDTYRACKQAWSTELHVHTKLTKAELWTATITQDPSVPDGIVVVASNRTGPKAPCIIVKVVTTPMPKP